MSRYLADKILSLSIQTKLFCFWLKENTENKKLSIHRVHTSPRKCVKKKKNTIPLPIINSKYPIFGGDAVKLCVACGDNSFHIYHLANVCAKYFRQIDNNKTHIRHIMNVCIYMYLVRYHVHQR